MAVDTPVRRSPLAHRAALEGRDGAVRLSEQPFLGKFVIRADPSAVADALSGAIGMSLPVAPLSSTTAGDTSLLWLGPDEWMLVTSPEAAEKLRAETASALAPVHHQLVAVSNYYTVIEVAGPKAREVLMKLATLDLHPREFKARAVAGSTFGRTQATLWQVTDDAEVSGPVFRLIVRWSMADYLWCLLANAAHEFGVPEARPVMGEKVTVD